MGIISRLFHKCGEHLEYIEGTRFPEKGTTGLGKVWKNYRCNVCGKMYMSCGNKLHRIQFQDAKPIKMTIGGCTVTKQIKFDKTVYEKVVGLHQKEGTTTD